MINTSSRAGNESGRMRRSHQSEEAMSNVIDSISIEGLRRSHFTQLQSYLEERDIEKWYYGDRKQFERRHQELLDWLESVIVYLSQEGVRIKK